MKIDSCDFEITKRCNLECRYCIYINKINNYELSFKEVSLLLEKLKNCGCKEIRFTGGEPFIRSDFFSILSKCEKLGLISKVLTNGTLLTENLIKKLSSLVSSLGISLDSHIKEINEKLRKNSFEKAFMVLKTCKKFSIPVSAYITLTKLNEPTIFEFLNYLDDIQINFHLTTVIPRGMAKLNTSILLSKPSDYYVKLFKSYFKEKKGKVKIKNNCEATFSSPFISSDGKLYPCVELYHNHESQIGCFVEEIEDREKAIKKIKKKVKCRYIVLFSDGCSVCVDIKKQCPLVGWLKNDKKFKRNLQISG